MIVWVRRAYKNQWLVLPVVEKLSFRRRNGCRLKITNSGGRYTPNIGFIIGTEREWLLRVRQTRLVRPGEPECSGPSHHLKGAMQISRILCVFFVLILEGYAFNVPHPFPTSTLQRNLLDFSSMAKCRSFSCRPLTLKLKNYKNFDALKMVASPSVSSDSKTERVSMKVRHFPICRVELKHSIFRNQSWFLSLCSPAFLGREKLRYCSKSWGIRAGSKLVL